jgi:hypothetical protein
LQPLISDNPRGAILISTSVDPSLSIEEIAAVLLRQEIRIMRLEAELRRYEQQAQRRKRK